METFYLISSSAGDIVPGIDLALLGQLPELDAPGVLDWMAGQGFCPENPDEVMYLSGEAAPDGFPALEVALAPRSAAAVRVAIAGILRDWAQDASRVRADRDRLIRAAVAAGLPKQQVAGELRISRQTVDTVLGG